MKKFRFKDMALWAILFVFAIILVNCRPESAEVIPQPPVANAGADRIVAVGDLVELFGSCVDPNQGQNCNLLWKFLKAPQGSSAVLSDQTISNPTFTADLIGQYEFELKVTDTDGYEDKDSVVITAAGGDKPVAVIVVRPDLNVDVGIDVELDGTDSFDPDGTDLGYHWSLLAKPSLSTAGINNAEAAIAAFNFDEPGIFRVELIVSDGLLEDTAVIDIHSNPPVINSFDPTSGPIGTEVEVFGKNFSNSLDGNVAYFNGEMANLSAASSTSLHATVPQNATTGPIEMRIVENNENAVSAEDFIVTQASPEWTEIVPPVQGAFIAVDFFGKNNGVIVGSKIGGVGIIMVSADGGNTWNEVASGVNNRFMDVAMLSEQVAVVVGYDGIILRSENGGNSWQQINSTTTNDLRGIDFPHPDTGYIAGLTTILRSWDGGQTWEDCTNFGVTTESFYDVSFSDPQRGTAVGWSGIIYRTIDGGESWARQFTGLIMTSFYEVECLDDQWGVICCKTVGDGTLMQYTDNGGALWQRALSPGINEDILGLFIGDDNIGYAVGDEGTILFTDNGGLSWVNDNCPFDNDLSGITKIGNEKYIAVGNGIFIKVL